MIAADRVRELGAILYYARIKEAWGPHWPHRDKWPKDEAAWRALPHHPCAEVELILVQAKAALAWMDEVLAAKRTDSQMVGSGA